MKKSIFSVILMANVLLPCYANELRGFEELKSAVIEGKVIRMYLDYAKCTTNSPLPVVNMIGVHTLNEIVINNKGQIGTWLLHFTRGVPQYPAKPIYEYIKYTISNDDSVVLAYTPLNAVDYTALGNTEIITCKMGESAKFFPVAA